MNRLASPRFGSFALVLAALLLASPLRAAEEKPAPEKDAAAVKEVLKELDQFVEHMPADAKGVLGKLNQIVKKAAAELTEAEKALKDATAEAAKEGLTEEERKAALAKAAAAKKRVAEKKEGLAKARKATAELKKALARGKEAERFPVEVEVRPGPAEAAGERTRPGIFVPEAKGADETLDETAKAEKTGQADTATTIRGDRIVGQVQTIQAGGALRLTAPHFEGPVIVRADALDTVKLTPDSQERPRGGSAGDEVALTNDDRLVGEVAAITPKHVVVESPAAGPLKIQRTVVEQIAFAQGRTLLLESNFASGRMAPWTPKEGGGWAVADGALQCTTHGHRKGVFAKFDQDEPVTFEAQVEATEGRYINSELIIFADQSEHTYGHTSVIARFYRNQFYLMYAHNGGTNSVINRSVGSVMRKGLLRLAYDPETAKARVWLDSRDLGEYTIPKKITEGKFVLFNARYSCKVPRLRVMRGIVPPSSSEEKSETEAHVVRFANKDRVAAKQVTLADGKLALHTSFGEIASPLDKVQSIAFRSKGLQEPRRRKGDIRVETANSRITVQFQRLTPDHLIGSSKHAGDVKIKRDAIKQIHFNIYR